MFDDLDCKEDIGNKSESTESDIEGQLEGLQIDEEILSSGDDSDSSSSLSSSDDSSSSDDPLSSSPDEQ